MKKVFIYIFIISIFSCDSQEKKKIFEKTILGGPDIHGYLYQKKYKKDTDSHINYNKWEGVIINNNKEIEELFKVNPNCEAIKFFDWELDTANFYELNPVIGNFKNLKYLEIKSCNISRFPKSIEKLKELEEIVLIIPGKEVIEFEFSNFQKLKHLTIQYAYQIKEFPYSIFNCSKLITIKLFHFWQTRESTLNGIERLENIKEIYIFDSHLNFPKKKFNFKQLETLIIDKCTDNIPKSFKDCKNIKRLAINSLYDTLDFNALSELYNIEILNLGLQNKFINELKLDKLQDLHISSFKGNDLDINIRGLKSLENYVIWGCDNITEINNISNNNLRSITIASNKNLKKIEFDENNLSSLEEVVIKYNDALLRKPAKVNKVVVQEN